MVCPDRYPCEGSECHRGVGTTRGDDALDRDHRRGRCSCLDDRHKDQINVSGHKVWPWRTSSTSIRAVHDAAVVGQPDDYQGESVVAYVSLRKGTSAGEAKLVNFARGGLAAYKRPRLVHIVAQLPKSRTGKIRRADPL
ncbi:hypothetical protein EEB14_58945 [Rhodococcus sp. WS4]|nr:hypothetical protein EEB14_58945 [Rhodococcus sp. WS4]